MGGEDARRMGDERPRRMNDGRPLRMGEEEAERIAVAALAHVAADEELLSRFMSMTGIEPAAIRAAATERGFLAGVLDFLMGHEPDALDFAARSGLAPDEVGMARVVLSGGGDPDPWTSA